GPPDADRDTFLGHGTPPRRVAAFGEQLPQLVFTHGHRAYLFLSAGVGRSVSSTRSRASARLAWLFTVPAEQPRMFATWASVMSSKYRSTTTARCPAGRRPSARHTASRSSTVSVSLAASGRSGSCP